MSKENKTEKRRILFTGKPSLKVKRTQFAATAQAAAGEQITLEGYAIVWNVLSSDRGGYQVRFLPGSAHFTDPTSALYHHSFMVFLGTTANGTLRIMPDDVGVKVEIDLPNTTGAADVAVLVDRGDVRGMSFSMLWDDVLVTTNLTENGVEVMEVSAFTCDEFTVTAIPAFVQTSVAIQAADDTGTATDGTQELSKVTIEAPERIAQSVELERHALNMRILDI